MLRTGSVVLTALLASSYGTSADAARPATATGAGAAAVAPRPVKTATLRLDHGTDWTARRDVASGVARVAAGPALELLAIPRPDLADVDHALRAFADDHVDLTGARGSDLGLAGASLHADGRRFVTYQQLHDGVPVVGARLHFQLRHASLLTFASTAHPGIAKVEPARLAAADAAARVDAPLLGSPRRAIYPRPTGAGFDHRPVWLIETGGSPATREQVIVDAIDGSILRRLPLAAHANRVVAEIDRFDYAPGTETVPVANVGGADVATNADGLVDATAAFSLALAGPRAHIVDSRAAQGGADFAPGAAGADDQGSALVWPVSTPIEQRSAWAYISRAQEHGLANAPDLAWFDESMPIHVNFAEGDFPFCNAFYMPKNYVEAGEIPATYFYAEGGGDNIDCHNTGRLFKVVAHEWGHGFHDHLLAAGLGIERDERSISEGVGDYIAFTLSETSTIIDGITTDESPTQYGARRGNNSLRYPDDLRSYDRGDGVLVDDVHHNGQIWSGSFWDLRALLRDLYGAAGGTRVADRLHAATLRGAPTFESAYELAIAADDDDGDPSNGTPHSCLITRALGGHGLVATPRPGQGAVRFAHDPLTTVAADVETVVSVLAQVIPECGELDPASVTLHYEIDGGGYEDVVMTAAGENFEARIPAQPDGALLRYFVSARTTDENARTFTVPVDANPIAVLVGNHEPAIRWDFEDGGVDWTHGSDAVLLADDWEIGAPKDRGFGPTAAASGSRVAGTDLGVGGGNGLYNADVSRSWLESPAASCRGCARLQFRRWLGLGEGDTARVLVNDQIVWDSAGEVVRDLDWTLIDIDLSGVDTSGEVHVRFELESDGASEATGWNVDDVSLFASATPVGGSDLVGGCQTGGTGTGLGAVLVLALVGVVRRRRARAAA